MKEAELNSLYRYAVALTKGDQEAYDLVHEAVLKCRGKLMWNQKAYIRTAIRHTYFDKLKKNKLEQPEESIEHHGDFNTNLEETTLSKIEIENLLEKLSDKERELLFLLFVEKWTYKEVAKFTKDNLNTVLARGHRLKEKIKNLMGGQNE